MSPEVRRKLLEVSVNWLLQQGVSTVLLFLLLIGGGYFVRQEVPRYVEMILDTHRDIEADHTKQLELVEKSYERDQERDERRWLEMWQRQRLGIVPAPGVAPGPGGAAARGNFDLQGVIQ